jgi:protein-S-isoprenylcysteine O-methyltransferase Ste14
MFVLIRALTYATLFVALVLMYIPASFLSWSGLGRPASFAWEQAVGLIVATAGAVLALWCVLTFAFTGKGTPAPFDPPRTLVIRGPYRYVRNPMYIGAGTALAGASLYFLSLPLLGYAVMFFVITHFFAVMYEEPTLRRLFGREYNDYCSRVHRWWPANPFGE